MKKILFIFLFLLSSVFSQNMNMALVLDGNDDFMNTHTFGFINLSSLTITAWINATAGYTIITNHLHGTSWESVDLLTYRFIINSDNTENSRQILEFPSIADSIWHHIAAVWNGIEMRIYLDGQTYGNTQISTNSPWYSTENIIIGARESTVTPPAVSELQGTIDELRIWRKALSQEQIQNTKDDTLGPEYYSTSDSGLIAYWRFDELENLGINGDGTDDIRDFSVNHWHGDLVGNAYLDTSGVLTHTNLISKNIPVELVLNQNYPNPFNPSTKIKYTLPISEKVKIEVFNLLGQKIETLLNKPMPSGSHKVEFTAKDLPSGVYLYRIESGDYQEVRKMILLK